MALVEETLFGHIDKVKMAIDLFREHEPPEGFQVNISYGKDSVVLLDLWKRSGTKGEAVYKYTTCDPPELIKFGKQCYPEVKRIIAKHTMWQLVKKKGLPTRKMRWCCFFLKEISGNGRVVVTGIRGEESNKRAEKDVVHMPLGNRKVKYFLNPIFHWTLADVWEYIDTNHLPYCSLYDEWWDRLGCVVCPMQTVNRRILSKERWPKLWDAMYRAGERWWIRRHIEGELRTDEVLTTWQEYWDHWFYETPLPNPDQTVMFE